MNSNVLTTQRQFQIDAKLENAYALIAANKKVLEEDAERQLNERMGRTLADFQIWPAWTVESTNNPGTQIHTLTAKIVFKP